MSAFCRITTQVTVKTTMEISINDKDHLDHVDCNNESRSGSSFDIMNGVDCDIKDLNSIQLHADAIASTSDETIQQHPLPDDSFHVDDTPTAVTNSDVAGDHALFVDSSSLAAASASQQFLSLNGEYATDDNGFVEYERATTDKQNLSRAVELTTPEALMDEYSDDEFGKFEAGITSTDLMVHDAKSEEEFGDFGEAVPSNKPHLQRLDDTAEVMTPNPSPVSSYIGESNGDEDDEDFGDFGEAEAVVESTLLDQQLPSEEVFDSQYPSRRDSTTSLTFGNDTLRERAQQMFRSVFSCSDNDIREAIPSAQDKMEHVPISAVLVSH
jgi:hypothetical protein